MMPCQKHENSFGLFAVEFSIINFVSAVNEQEE